MKTKLCEVCGNELVAVLRPMSAFAKEPREVEIWPDCSVCLERSERAAIQQANELNRERWMRLSRLPVECRVLSLEQDVWPGLIVDRHNHEAIGALREWVAGEGGLYVCGSTGCGKSLLSMAAAMDCLRKPEEVLFLSEREIGDLVRLAARRTGKASEDAADTLMRMATVPVLVLDDVFRHKLEGGTGFLVDRYFDTLDARLPAFGKKLKTLIVSQLTPVNAGKMLNDGAIVRRMMGLCDHTFVECGGADRSVVGREIRKWVARG